MFGASIDNVLMKVVLFMTLLNSSLRYSRNSVIREDFLDSTSGTALDSLLIWIISKFISDEVFSVPKSAHQTINSWKAVTVFHSEPVDRNTMHAAST